MPAAEFVGRRKRAATLLAAASAAVVVCAGSIHRAHAATVVNGTVAAGEYPAGAIATTPRPPAFNLDYAIEINSSGGASFARSSAAECDPEGTREGSPCALRCQMLREYAQHDKARAFPNCPAAPRAG